MEGLKMMAELMAISARTAPKSAGKDFIEIQILEGEEVQKLAEGMVKFGQEKGKSKFDRDGKNVGESEIVVLIGLKDDRALGLNCGACGYATCKELEEAKKLDVEFKGPTVHFGFWTWELPWDQWLKQQPSSMPTTGSSHLAGAPVSEQPQEGGK